MYIREITVSVDLDSTLVDILTPWIYYINIKESSNYKIKDVKKWNQDFIVRNIDFVLKEDLYDNLVPISGAVNFIKSLQSKYNVQIVTHTLDGHRESKLKFIKRYFGDITVVTTNECKLSVTKDTILIDDNLEHIQKHININKGIGIVYTMNNLLKYNISEDVVRLHNYEDILRYLSNH